jgi:hypothetical protein
MGAGEGYRVGAGYEDTLHGIDPDLVQRQGLARRRPTFTGLRLNLTAAKIVWRLF